MLTMQSGNKSDDIQCQPTSTSNPSSRECAETAINQDTKGGYGKTSKCQSSRIPKPNLNKNPVVQLRRSETRFRFS